MAQIVLTGVQAVVVACVVFYGYLTLPWYLYPALIALFAEAVSQALESLPQTGKGKKAKPGQKVDAKELAKHNTEESLWVAVRGKVYDLTEWLPNHPGGKELVLLMAGREISDIFDSYHPFTEKPNAVLPKLLIGDFVGEAAMPTYKEDSSGFYNELKSRVAAHLKSKNIDEKAAWPAIWRMSLVIAVAFTCFYVMHLAGVSVYVQFICGAIFGACQALPLLHIMHDCSHSAWTHNEIMWKWAGRLMMDWYAGASMTAWHNQHVVGHHVHTNILGADPDLPVDMENDIRRLTPVQVWKAHYRYQYLYLIPLYGLLGLKFRFQDFLLTFIARTNGPVDVNPIMLVTWVKQVASKLNFIVWRLLIPYYVFGCDWSTIAWVFLWCELCTGWYLAINFQVSHVSTEADFPAPENSKDYEWAKMQIATSVDYSHGDNFMTFLAGALNYQTCHHLFPAMSQYLYPEIAPVVMEVCKEHGVKYNCLPDFTTALVGHIEHLRIMGMKDAEAADYKKKNQ